MKVKMLRTFVPSINFELSKQFYTELGFKILWEDDTLCQLGTPEYNFFLQPHYPKEWAENMMLQLIVEDLDALYETVLTLKKKYKDIKINPIFTADYGRTFHLIAPAGELWHMTEAKK